MFPTPRSWSVFTLSALICLLVSIGSTQAGVEDWQLSEVHLQSMGDPRVRYLELENLVGGCLFPSSTIDIYDSAGTLLSTVGLTLVTSCFPGPTYFLIATAEAADHFATARDRVLLAQLPMTGQACFSSSATKYDCVRWGMVDTAVVDLFGSGDESTTTPPPDGESLSRIATTHVVLTDWESRAPTPRGPSDGTPWSPPDAGPVVDAGIDASIPDAGQRSDARDTDARPDARNTRFLDLDAVGGADCGCNQSKTSTLWSLLLLSFLLLWQRRRRG